MIWFRCVYVWDEIEEKNCSLGNIVLGNVKD